MIITDGEKTMTLEELAGKICSSFEECEEGKCPGFNECRVKQNGILVWLKKVLGND